MRSATPASGDKGFHANIGLIVYDKKHYELIREQVTSERVRSLFQDSVKGEVKRYELPRMGALNFVLRDALDGGATRNAYSGRLRQGPQFRAIES